MIELSQDYNKAVIDWILAHGEVLPSYRRPVSTVQALAELKAKGVDVALSGNPEFVKVITELGGYGVEPKKEKVVSIRVVPVGDDLYRGDFEFFVLREDFDLMLLGVVAGFREDVDYANVWMTRTS